MKGQKNRRGKESDKDLVDADINNHLNKPIKPQKNKDTGERKEDPAVICSLQKKKKNTRYKEDERTDTMTYDLEGYVQTLQQEKEQREQQQQHCIFKPINTSPLRLL